MAHLTYSTDLLAAYMKMESVEFYAELLYQVKDAGRTEGIRSRQLIAETVRDQKTDGSSGQTSGKPLPEQGREELPQLRRQLPQSTGQRTGNMHRQRSLPDLNATNPDLVAAITKKVMAQLGLQ